MNTMCRATTLAAAAAATACVLTLAGCHSATYDRLHTLMDQCSAGDQHACDVVPMYQRQEEIEAKQRAARAAALAGFGAAIERATQPHYYFAPVAPAPVSSPLNCTSMGFGDGIVHTQCQ